MNETQVTLQPKHVGSYGELKATVWLMDQGYDVFRNVSAAGLIDLVAIKGAEVLKLDVKYSRGGNRQGANSKGSNAAAQRELGIKWLNVLGDKFEIADPPDAKGHERRKCVICSKSFKTNIGSAQKTCCKQCSLELARRKRNESKCNRAKRKLAQRPLLKKKCEVCKTSFETPLPRKITCSSACSKNRYKRLTQDTTKTCSICDASYLTTSRNKSKTCSAECADQFKVVRKLERNAARKKKFAIGPQTKFCVVCENSFVTANGAQIMCSDECAGIRLKTKGRDRHRRIRKTGQASRKNKQCVICDKSFPVGRGNPKTCSLPCRQRAFYLRDKALGTR